jgi:hypothetical protein
MSVDLYACPIPSTLPLLSNPDCPAIYGNISAVALQLKQASPSFTGTSIAALATWTPLLASSAATGIRVIPCTNFETTPGEAITEGGNDQTTTKGRQKLKYVGFSTLSYRMEGVTAAFAKAVVAYTKYSALAGQRTNLRAFFLTDDNYIISNLDFNGIEIWNHVVMDVKKGGAYKLEDNYMVAAGMDYGWSFDAVTTKASFDVLSLVNATV